jgi:hypothetical protein
VGSVVGVAQQFCQYGSEVLISCASQTEWSEQEHYRGGETSLQCAASHGILAAHIPYILWDSFIEMWFTVFHIE